MSARLRITGRVQGVWYRVSAAQAAERVGITGWVRNLPDHSVEALAQGPRDVVDTFITWCGDGPPGARVDEVSTEWLEDAEAYSEFTVRR